MQTFIPRDEADLRVRLINLSGKLFIYFLFIVLSRLSFFFLFHFFSLSDLHLSLSFMHSPIRFLDSLIFSSFSQLSAISKGQAT